MKRPVLVTGFGPFKAVHDNPTARTARAVDGRVIDGRMIVGHVLPVTYADGPELAIRLARALDAELVIGLGVSGRIDRVEVETVGRRRTDGSEDNDGRVAVWPQDGPAEVPATVDAQTLADALGAALSDDAGAFVCNRWAWRVPQALTVPAVFVHVPPAGLPADRLVRGIEALLP